MSMSDERPDFKLSELAAAIIKPLEASSEPRDVALAAAVKMIDGVQQEVKWQTPYISEIDKQTKKTNGRVDKVEERLGIFDGYKNFAWGFIKAGSLLAGVVYAIIEIAKFTLPMLAK